MKFVIHFKNVFKLFLKFSKRYKKKKIICSTLLFFNKRYLVCDHDSWDYIYSREISSVLMEKSWYRTREDTREEALRASWEEKKKGGGRRGGVRLMGSSWIVVPFFFVPGSQLVPSLPPSVPLAAASPGRGLSGTTSTTTPNERPQKNSSNLSLPRCLLPIASSVTNWLGWDRCALTNPGVSSSASTFRNHFGRNTNTHAYTHAYTRDTRASYLQVRLSTARLTRDVRTFPPRRGGPKGGIPPEESIPLRCGFLLSRRADSLLENSCRRADCGFEGHARVSEVTRGYDRKNSLQSTRVYQPRVLLNALLLLFFFFFSLLTRH